jgi:signal transduction histidine kinase
MTIAVPVKKWGVITGAITGDINLRGMWDIVDNIKLGRTGSAFLVSREGIVLAHRDKKIVLKQENFGDQHDVRAVITGSTGSIELMDPSGIAVISSYAPIADAGWGIILRQEQNEAYQSSRLMKWQSWIIILISELLAILVSIFIANMFAKPIKTLAGRLKMIAAGNLGHTLEVRREDEFGELLKSFNHMIEKLKKARARERLSVVGETTSRIAHEFKNYLVPIKLFAQLLPKRHADKDFIDKFEKAVPEGIKQCERILKELSEFSSRSELMLAPADIKIIIEKTLSLLDEKFIAHNIAVHYNTRGDPFRITADAERLQEVFMNLMINAIDVMPRGGALYVVLSFKYKHAHSSQLIEVKITDTGKGIPREELSNIFELFYTSKKGNMGLGLAITRSIIEQHGGTIQVDSEINRGTQFTVVLPS